MANKPTCLDAGEDFILTPATGGMICITRKTDSKEVFVHADDLEAAHDRRQFAVNAFSGGTPPPPPPAPPPGGPGRG